MKKIFIILANSIFLFIFVIILFITFTGFGMMTDIQTVRPWYYYLWLGLCAISIFVSIFYSSKRYIFLALPLIILITPYILISANNFNITNKLLSGDPVKICGSMKDVGSRSMCYSGIGVKRKDLSICDLSELYRGDCYYEIITKQSDPNLCEKMPDINNKDYCYREFGLCNKIINKAQLEICNNRLINKN